MSSKLYVIKMYYDRGRHLDQDA